MQPLLVTALSLEVGVTAPQLSVAVAEPRAALIVDPDGLQPSVNVVPVAVITGGVVSRTVIVWFREALVLPQASTACQVLVRE